MINILINLAIHISTSEKEFKKNKSKFNKTYSKTEPSMYEYCASWFEGIWSNWMIYCSKPGLANTNSNIESFNNVLKRDYFERRKVPMRTAINKLFECITYYSTEYSEFKTIPGVKSIWSNCSHLVGYDLIAGLNLFHIKGRAETFVPKMKKGPKKSNAIKNKIGKALQKDE